MYQFNNQLEVGQLAMIINTHHPENQSMVGKIVTVECLTEKGDDLARYWQVVDRKVIESRDNMVVCSGITPPKPALDTHGHAMISGYVRLRKEYLMPLPPLEEKEVKREMELTQ